jgi:hypothetical protein
MLNVEVPFEGQALNLSANNKTKAVKAPIDKHSRLFAQSIG